MIVKQRQILALTGGVGGAKLCLGLSKVLAPGELTMVANTADDFTHLGLSISPDLDTLLYTLAGISNTSQGWGLAGESWQVMASLKALGGDTWFQLGDKDIATHLARTQRLKQGQSLSEVTRYFCQQLGIEHRVLPMTDDPVATVVHSESGELAFQEYFVRDQCKPRVQSLHFEGIAQAKPQAQMLALLAQDALDAIVICPSNPFVSISPIIQLPGVRAAMRNSSAVVVAVSPIVGGLAIKGPAAKMMHELSMPASAAAVADYYGDLLDGFVLDQADEPCALSLKASGLPLLKTRTVMRSLQDRIDLAREVLSFCDQIGGSKK